MKSYTKYTSKVMKNKNYPKTYRYIINMYIKKK